jgi:spore maturation protein CgeB
MKLLYACWLDAATSDLPLFSAQAWRRRGHQVELFAYDLEFANLAEASLLDRLALQDDSLRQARFFRRLSQACERARPDALLFAFPFVSPAAMRRLRDVHRVRIGFSLGYNNLFDAQIAESIAISDFVLVHDSYLVPVVRGRASGARVFHFGAAADPSEHHPLSLSEWDVRRYGAEVGFIGGHSPNRAAALIPLARHALRIWGSAAWSRVPQLAAACADEPIYGLKKTKIYNACSIIVSLEVEAKNLHALSCRVPEVLACGGFVISQRSPDLDATGLEDGKSVATFDDPADLADKVAYYLAHPDERRRISENGRRSVLESITYDACYGPILDRVAASLNLDDSGSESL